MHIEIRPERAGDESAIGAVTAAAFRDARHSSHTEQIIVEQLRATGQLAVSLVADAGGDVVGHVALSPVSVSDGASGWFGLGPLSVRPDCQRRGLGSRLVREALRRLRAQGGAGCVVLGEPDYYGRFGFAANSGLVLPGVPAEYFQAVAFGAALAAGNVSYPAAFDA